MSAKLQVAKWIYALIITFILVCFIAANVSKAGIDPIIWKYYPYTIPGTEIVIPDDDGKHSNSMDCDSLLFGEWWYASIHLTGNSGREYGSFVAYFLTPTFRKFKVFSISDLDNNQNYTYNNIMGVLLASSTHLDLTYVELFSSDRWYNTWQGLQLEPFEYRLLVDGESRENGSHMKLDLDMESLKPPMKVGDNGIIYLGNSFSYYYSHPRVEVSGEITVNGLTENVTGVAWIDHQYGCTDITEYVSWEWFAITLDDFREIMVSDVWVNGFFAGSHSEGMNYFSQNFEHQLLPDYTITGIESSLWIDSATGFRYPTQWHIEETSKNMDLYLTADYENQFMPIDDDPWGILPMPEGFWEGVCSVTGTIQGSPVSGKAYAELTHSRGWPLRGATSGRLPKQYGPYLVVDDVFIPDNSTLTIDPGVEVLFVGDYKFDVYGTLKAKGTKQDSIVFTHYESNPDSTWGGLRFHDAGSACTLKYCIVEYGHATGGGFDSFGGGIYCDNSSPFISHCTIRKNAADGMGGGLCLFGSDAVLERCLIVQNFNGGIYFGGNSDIILDHCTISDNDEYGIQSPASEFADWDMTVSNTIIYDNYGYSVISAPNSFSATYCDIEDYYYGGTGNIDCDPQFVNYYRLDSGSCCIDAGNPDPSNNDPDGTRGDIGVFYYPQSSCPYVSVWDSGKYTLDNNILPQSEGLDRGRDVTDYYLLRHAVVAEDNRYLLRVEEFEGEQTFADEFNLTVVDYPNEYKLGVSESGEFFIYSEIISPISVYRSYDSDYSAISEADIQGLEKVYAGETVGLNFGPLRSENGARLVVNIEKGLQNGIDNASPVSRIAIPDTAVHKPSIPVGIGNGKLNSAELESGLNIEFDKISSLRPRENGTIVIADVTCLLPDDGRDFILWLHFPLDYRISVIGLDCTEQRPLNSRRLTLNSAIHSYKGDITDRLVRTDNLYAELLPDQHIDLSFECTEPVPGLKRDFVLISTGHYDKYQPSPYADNPDIEGKVSVHNYPNPFNPVAIIDYTLPTAANVKIEIFNIMGQKVTTLVDIRQDAGPHSVRWDGGNFASGMYFYRFQAGDYVETRKIILIK